METLLTTVAEFVAKAPSAIIGPDDPTVKDILTDCLACAAVGTTTRFGGIALEFARQYGTPPAGGLTATVIGSASPISVMTAAWVNTVLINALDYEPVGPEGHMCATVVPTALAFGQATGSSAEDILDAILLGVEVGGRIGAAIRRPAFVSSNNRTPPVTGMPYAVIGSAAAAGRVLGLNAERLAHAMAIAAYSAPVPTLRAASNAAIAPMTKYDALAVHSRNAAEAVLLAQLGARGDLQILEGEHGFWRIVGSTGLDPTAITDGLGETWKTATEIYYKRYPCVLYTSPVLEAIAELRESEPGLSEELSGIEIRTRDPKPGQRSRHAETEEDAWYSIPINAALTLLGDSPRSAWRRPEVYAAPAVRRIAEMTDVDRWRDGFPEPEPGQGPWSGWAPCKVTANAGSWSREVRKDNLTRLIREELEDKWHECLTSILSAEQASEIIAALANVENCNLVDIMIALQSDRERR